MNEKKIWKWIVNSYSDEGMRELVRKIGIKVPGFRKINEQNFKIVRPKLVQILQNNQTIKILKRHFHNLGEQDDELKKVKEKDLEGLLELMKEEIEPTLLFSLLMSTDNQEQMERAEKLYARLEEQGKLESIVHPTLEENVTAAAEPEQKPNEELIEVMQTVKNLERKLKKEKQNIQAMIGKLAVKENNLEKEKILRKEDHKKHNQDIGQLRKENKKLRDSLVLLDKEKETFMAEKTRCLEALKEKDAEISRLNALCLQLRTKVDPQSTASVQENMVQLAESQEGKQKVNVALLGDPRTSKIPLSENYEIVIIEAANIEAEIENNLFEHMDEIWILNYRTSVRIRKMIKKVVKDKALYEFPTFIDLENYIMEG